MRPAAGSHCISMFTSREKVEFTRSSSLFFASFRKLRLPEPVQIIHRLAWKIMFNELYGISDVKVKLADSLI